MTDVGGVMDGACERQKKLREGGWRGSSTTSGLLEALATGALLGFACLISYFVITGFLGKIYFLSRDDELLGGMWSVIATIFVYRHTYQQRVRAALSRVAATLVSFALCLVYLLIFPFHPWGMAALIGIGAIMTLAGRSEDIITTGTAIAKVGTCSFLMCKYLLRARFRTSDYLVVQRLSFLPDIHALSVTSLPPVRIPIASETTPSHQKHRSGAIRRR